MNQRWFVRQLISYVPIFLLITSFLAYITFFSLTEMAKQSTEQVNELATERLLQLVDYSLQDIDNLVIKDLSNNAKLIRYFYAGKNRVQEESEASETIRSWTIINPFIHSVYLYRKTDDIVLTNTLRIPLTTFTDAEFLQEQLESNETETWTNPRMYHDPSFQGRTEKVVSLVKRVPFTNGELGLLVVNVKVASLEPILKPSSSSNVSLIELYDTGGQAFYPQPTEQNLKVLTELQSSYTNWTIRSGSAPFKFADYSDNTIITSVSVGILSIVVGTLWFIFAIRMNYKPIGTIMNRLKAVTLLKNDGLPSKSNHELQIIEVAIDNLIQQSIDYEKTHEEDLMLRRRVFFHDVLQGNRIVKTEEWRAELEHFHLPSGSNGFRIALVEIDHYSQFSTEYHQRDKNLLKFAMGNVAREMAASVKLSIWVEWLEGSHMGILFLDDNPDHTSVVIDMLERYREWVQQHLKYTVTIGLGNSVDASEHILVAYGQAEEALEKKIISGANQVIVYEQVINDALHAPIHEFLVEIREVTRMYRMGEPQWEDVFNELFRALRVGNMSKDDTITIVNLLLNTFYREMMELPEEYLHLWKKETMPIMNDAFAEFESLDKVRTSFLAALCSFEAQLRASREAKQYAPIVEQIRSYIDEHYTNPDISLTHLGEVFHTNPKYISFIFKEQLGVKFVNYLTDVRVEQAKRLLLSTDDLIPDIAAQVGYVHAVSFNRVFKKVVGMTPGGYRNRNDK
ncbi:helix-turn-helix domain-containing protein [Paenibacillus daejeonensis]|uniref:helix-turn-helix domain-containing protein n=1 Tax=Paenibacillus daejeonensis TaxID=135193 RepID=UPI00036F6615|nr:helix-turn-helix domain-containing protein [Paenibacillus daejeonensis]